LVLKYVNRVPSATPACFDISDVGAAVRPRSANRRVAASRIALRLSSLLGRATELLYYRVHTQLYRGNMLMASAGGGRNGIKPGPSADRFLIYFRVEIERHIIRLTAMSLLCSAHSGLNLLAGIQNLLGASRVPLRTAPHGRLACSRWRTGSSPTTRTSVRR
jgi:hypothetical protein